MSATTPEEAHELFVKLFNAGDIEGLLSLYEPGATLIPFPGEPVTGRDSIRTALEGFLSLNGHMDLTIDRCFTTEYIALLFSTWTLKSTDPEGKQTVVSGQTSDVVRKQRDGSWLFVIDNPQGAAAAKA